MYFIALFLLTCSFITLSTCSNNTTTTATGTTSSYQFIVPECDKDFHLSIPLLPYELYTDNIPWSSDEDYHICPRSDYDGVQHWQILFRNSTSPLHSTLSGSYYLNNSYPPELMSTIGDLSTVACIKDNSQLIVNPRPHLQGEAGVLQFMFISENEFFKANLTVKYASTGVYSDQSMVYFNEGIDRFALLTWYIYYPNHSVFNTYQLTHNGQAIKDQSTSLDSSMYSAFWSISKCPSLFRDQTYYLILAVLNPRVESSTGKYTLSVGDYSDTVSLVAIPSSTEVTPTNTVPVVPTTSSTSKGYSPTTANTRIVITTTSSHYNTATVTTWLPQQTGN